MSTSSIFHFFARLMDNRGYFGQDNKLGDFVFPREMIAVESSSGFPDFVLKTNPQGRFSGGEFIELKDAKSYQISSFNSTLPTAVKPVSSLSNVITRSLQENGEDLDALPERDVYYLVRGMKRDPRAPLAKTVLVSGAFFQTLPVSHVLTEAFGQVATDSANPDVDVTDLTDKITVEQRNFAASRHVEGSGFSVRFRVMAQADPLTNLFSSDRYPMIGDNTLTFLTHDNGFPTDAATTQQFAWHDAPDQINSCDTFDRLSSAIADVDPSMNADIRVSILRHPLNGPFFMAQVPIHPSQ